MSAPQKPQGGKNSLQPLARLKQCTAEEREWAFLLRNSKNTATGEIYTNAECRGEIRERLGISLGTDGSYSDFCSWQFRQRQWDVLGDLASEDEAQLRDRYPNLNRDQIREAIIKRQYAVAEMLGDPKHTLRVIKVDQAESTGRSRAALEKEKLKLAKEAEDRQREEHRLNREKFEFDAAKAAKKFAAEIKTISANPKLNESQKINAIRQRLFGVLPEQVNPPAP